ncbi:unnamed protein product [Adineta ricciae]|uniref:Uncharacterized protein n=1 Tax=Adineta ricciae TaxID=249248 RepID=A0A813TP55_ADIRI|nr:unnamed protein product [Adineta ricciae]
MSIDYNNNSDFKERIKHYTESANDVAGNIWQKEQDFLVLMEAFGSILSTIQKSCSAGYAETNIKLFQDVFQRAARSIIDDYKQLAKVLFLSDLYFIAGDEINAQLLIQQREPTYKFLNDRIFEELGYKIVNERNESNEKGQNLPCYPKERDHQKAVQTLYDIYDKVAQNFDMSISNLYDYMKKKRNRNQEVHIAQRLVDSYRNKYKSQDYQLLHFSTTLLPVFTSEDIKNTEKIFNRYIQYSKLSPKEKMRPTEHLWIQRQNKSEECNPSKVNTRVGIFTQ